MTKKERKVVKNKVLLFSLFFLAFLLLGFFVLRVKTNLFDKFLGAYNVKISVIIPVYNTEKYLDKCLESVQNQTFRDIEIICVDDGSTDSSPEILKTRMKKDKRIKVIHQENQGVSAARNNGMKNARGDYIMFLDSDDYYLPYVCEKEYNIAIKNEANVVEFGVQDFVDGDEVDVSSISYDDSKITVYTRAENENPFDALNYSCGVIWNKIWKKSFITENNLTFKEGEIRRGEDSLFNMMAAPNLYKHVKDCNAMYMYRTGRPGSAMTVTQNNVKKKLDSFLIIAKELADNRNNFSFDGGDNWILSMMLDLLYFAIFNELDDYKDKLYYCEKALEVIEKDFLEKYSISLTPGSENEFKINDMRKFILYRID